MPRPTSQVHNAQFGEGVYATPKSPAVSSYSSSHHQMIMPGQHMIPMTSDGLMTNGPSYIAVGSSEGTTGMEYSRTENASTAQDSTSGSTHSSTGSCHAIHELSRYKLSHCISISIEITNYPS